VPVCIGAKFPRHGNVGQARRYVRGAPVGTVFPIVA